MNISYDTETSPRMIMGYVCMPL